MEKKIGQSLFFIVLILVAPLLPRPTLILTWPLLFTAAVGMTLNLTQPRWSIKEMFRTNPQDRHSLAGILLAGLLTFLVPVLDYGYGRQARPDVLSFWSAAGICAAVGGLALRIWAIRLLGKFFTARVEVQDGQRVVQEGPYRYLRHPSYLGAWLMGAGLSLLFRSYAGLLFCLLGYLAAYVYRISVEEKALRRELGDAYVRYVRRTWRMIPFVY